LDFRAFRGDDAPECSQFAAEAWPILSALVPAEDVVKFMRAYVEVSRLASTWREVARISERVVGFLFGRINADYTRITVLKAFFFCLIIGVKVILGRYGHLARPLTFLKKFMRATLKVQRNAPRSDAEVVLFVVDSKHRGKGIGTALMDRFVSAAKDKKTKVIMLSTDPLSNWKFYEKYGFKRYSTFEDDLNSYIKNEDVESYIYAIGIDRM
jgi:ribosomal protein S18 acetylase RimI-like enzyme